MDIDRHGFGQLANVDAKIRKYIMEDIMTDTVIHHLRLIEALVEQAAKTSCREGGEGGEAEGEGSAGAGVWVAGTATPTIADFTLLPRLRALQAQVQAEMDFDIFAIFPLLRRVVDRLYALPQIRKYYQNSDKWISQVD